MPGRPASHLVLISSRIAPERSPSVVVLSPHVLFVARGDRTAGSGYTRRIVAADRFTGGSSFRGRRAGDRGLSAATLQRRQAEEYLR